MNLRTQKRMAAQILKCGIHRVWIDPEHVDEVAEAITKDDIRRLIREGKIGVLPKQGVSTARAKYIKMQKKKGRRRGHGSRKGKKTARMPRKLAWMIRIRALRRLLRELRDRGEITRSEYRMLYAHAKGGMFRSKAHLLQRVEKLKEMRSKEAEA